MVPMQILSIHELSETLTSDALDAKLPALDSWCGLGHRSFLFSDQLTEDSSWITSDRSSIIRSAVFSRLAQDTCPAPVDLPDLMP